MFFLFLQRQDKFETEDDYREKTVRFSGDDACMDVTQSHTVNIATDVKLPLDLPSDSFCPVKKQESEKRGPLRDRSSSALSSDQGFNSGVEPVIARMTPKAATSSSINDLSSWDQMCPEDDVSMDMTEAQTGKILEMSDSGHLQLHLSSQDMSYQHGDLKKPEMTSHLQSTEVLRSSHCKGMEATNLLDCFV